MRVEKDKRILRSGEGVPECGVLTNLGDQEGR